ncbi:MAG TPA: TlpA disulfide reductase family protein, partial [Vicinamibacteria bacterium]|nr:TlpA disulfide reductase family protein [Vicinamibacteria bacterium]
RVDVDAVLAHPRFGKLLERTLSGLEGKPAPPVQAARLDGAAFDPASLAGRAHVVYFWFSNCPPCMQTAPVLAELAQGRSVPVVAVNADAALDLGTSDADLLAYTAKLKPFTHVRGTAALLEAYGGVSVYPTLFFVDKQGMVVRQSVNRQDRAALDAALAAALD